MSNRALLPKNFNLTRSLTDCNLYYSVNGCKISECQFRHSPAAKGTTEVCEKWISNSGCTWRNCPKRHITNRGNVNEEMESLLEGLFDDEDCEQAVEAVKHFSVAPDVVKKTCGLCCGNFGLDEMFNFVKCTHEVCRECAIEYFTSQIKNKSVKDVVCPYPSCVNLDANELHDYLSILLPQLKSLLSDDIMELLEKKVRDLTLGSDPNFIWCPNCPNGMIVEDMNTNYVECSHCQSQICPQCKKLWTRQHVGLNCDDFQQWLVDNDLDKQTDALETLLLNFGVACPKCQTKFVKSAGGCLHLTCSTCKHKFCEGCLQPYYSAGECPTMSCAPLGFHAHHLRNCSNFLRDWSPERLQRLLQMNNINFKVNSTHGKTTCKIVVQKEIGEKWCDEECNEPVEPFSEGFCRKHYIQYLVWLVLKNKVDPLPLYTTEELEQLLIKARATLPAKTPNYQQDLFALVKNLKDGGMLSETSTIAESFAPILESANAKTDSCDKEEDNCSNSDDDSDGNELFHSFSSKEDYVFSARVNPEGACGEATVDANSWKCVHCTYINDISVTVCAMCARSRKISLNEYEYTFDGIKCPFCTFLNKFKAEVCEICENNLEGIAVVDFD